MQGGQDSLHHEVFCKSWFQGLGLRVYSPGLSTAATARISWQAIKQPHGCTGDRPDPTLQSP